MSDEDHPPDLSRLKEGYEITAYYRSMRSGNEVDRGGEVTAVKETEKGHFARVYIEQRDCFKHQYMALADATTDRDEDVVAAYSITAEAEPPAANEDNPPILGRMYPVRFEPERTSILGIVDRIVREDGPGPFLVTDGGTEVV